MVMVVVMGWMAARANLSATMKFKCGTVKLSKIDLSAGSVGGIAKGVFERMRVSMCACMLVSLMDMTNVKFLNELFATYSPYFIPYV